MNTNLDEIAAVIGYTATRTLVVWFGDGYLSVPARAEADSALGRLIGGPALRALVRAYGNTKLWINAEKAVEAEIRDKTIAEKLTEGLSCAKIAREIGVPHRTVVHVRQKLLANRSLEIVEAKNG